MASLLQRYESKILGMISCYDRILIQGTLPGLCYAQGMTAYLKKHDIRIFDYPHFAEPLRDLIRTNAEHLAQENNVEIEYVRKANFRKEDRIRDILKLRGDQPGLVHILSAMESCPSYKPWHDKRTGNTYLRPDTGKCLHYYFYFIDEVLGLCHLRVPTWCPFRLQFYFNGHSYLANQLSKNNVKYQMLDNAFVNIDNFQIAQELADNISAFELHQRLDAYAKVFCPVIETLHIDYHWSIMQIEYATDVIFKRQSDLAPIYENITRTAIHSVKPDKVATFLGRKLNGNYQDELGNNFSTRIEGTCIKHHMGPVSIKMYDKHNIVLRIETTVNNVSFFKHHRTVEQRNGPSILKLAPVKKSIYSIGPLTALLAAANHRYLAFISEIDDPSAGQKLLNKISEPIEINGRTYKGLNFFSGIDQNLLEIIARGEHCISGFRHKDLHRHLPDLSEGQLSRRIKSLHAHGLLKRIGRTYKYYVTKLGCRIIATALKLKELFIIPQLAQSRI